MISYEKVGLEVITVFRNDSNEDFFGELIITPKSPSYLTGWTNYCDDNHNTLRIPAHSRYVDTTLVYLHPTAISTDKFAFYAHMWRGNRIRYTGSFYYEVQVRCLSHPSYKPATILDEPSYTAGQTNTIRWIPVDSEDLIGQEAYAYDVNDPQNLIKSLRYVYKTSSSDTMVSVFEGLQDGHTYGFFIRTDYEKGRVYSLYSRTVYSTQDHTPPGSVLCPLALPLGERVEITWRAVSDALSGVARYEIYRSAPTGEEILLDVVNVPNPQPDRYRWIDSNVVPGKTYAYRIRAVDRVGNRGEGEISDAVQVKGVGSSGQDVEGPVTQTPKPPKSSNAISYLKGAVDTLRFSLPDPKVKRIRFEAVREDTGFFKKPPKIGARYFDSGWIDPPFPPYWVFDYGFQGAVRVDLEGRVVYGSGDRIDLNFVDGHTYYRRFTYDYGTTQRQRMSSVVPDCFPPEDIRNLTALATVDEVTNRWGIHLSWDFSRDKTSGLKGYRIYRRILGQDPMPIEIFITPSSEQTAFRDDLTPFTFDPVRNPIIAYYVVAEDGVGNRRAVTEASWEAKARALAAPRIAFEASQREFDLLRKGDTLLTRREEARLLIRSFDPSMVIRYEVDIDGQVETLPVQDTLVVPLPDRELIPLKVRAVYPGDRKTVWSDRSHVLRARPIPPSDLRVWSDSTSWEGHHFLSWKKPSADVVYYEIWRQEIGDGWRIIGRDSSGTSEVQWVDRVDLDELTGEKTVPLVAYAPYVYRIRKVDPFGVPSPYSKPDTIRCLRAPELIFHRTQIHETEYSIHIRWKRARPTRVERGFKTLIRVYQDTISSSFAQEFRVDDDTTFVFSPASSGHNYIFRLREIPNDPAIPPSFWSRPYTVSFVLLDPFAVQPQPKKKIFVFWHDPERIRKYRISRFTVCRDDSCYSVPAHITEWMDESPHLIHGQVYRYRVSGLDSLGQVVAAQGKSVQCDSGAVYIPFLTGIPKYFYDDSITVSWVWRDIDGRVTSSPRGATRCWIEVSASRLFPPHPNETVTVGPLPSDFSSRTARIPKPLWVDRHNIYAYFRIRAEDAWGHPVPPLWSTAFDDTVRVAIYDTKPPRSVKDLHVQSVSAWYRAPDTVEARLQWSGAGVEFPEVPDPGWDPLLANVAGYRLYRDGLQLYETRVQPGMAAYFYRDLLPNRPSTWHVVVFDSAGREAPSATVRHLGFVPTPIPPQPIDYRACELIPLTTDSMGIHYAVEIAMHPEHFVFGYELGEGDQIDRILCRSGWITDLSFRYAGGWGAIALDSTWFRVKAGRWWRGVFWESGWSPIVPYGGDKVPHAPKPDPVSIPERVTVHPNYPNPFNTQTVIPFDLPSPGIAQVSVYDITGKRVKRLVDGPIEAGRHQVVWDGTDDIGQMTASGLYIIHVYLETQKVSFERRLKVMMVK